MDHSLTAAGQAIHHGVALRLSLHQSDKRELMKVEYGEVEVAHSGRGRWKSVCFTRFKGTRDKHL